MRRQTELAASRGEREASGEWLHRMTVNMATSLKFMHEYGCDGAHSTGSVAAGVIHFVPAIRASFGLHMIHSTRSTGVLMAASSLCRVFSFHLFLLFSASNFPSGKKCESRPTETNKPAKYFIVSGRADDSHDTIPPT